MVVDLGEYRKIMNDKRENGDYSLAGGQGFCFIHNDKVIKIYNCTMDAGNICDLSRYKSCRISFPEEYTFDEKERIAGEVMPYFTSNTLNKGLTPSCSLDKFIYHYDEMVKEIKEFPNLLMLDMGFYENILYDEKMGMFLIDVSRWREKKGSIELNIKELDKAIMDVLKHIVYEDFTTTRLLFEIIDGYQLLKENYWGSELLKALKACLIGDYHIKDLIDTYQMTAKSIYDDEIKTFEDMKKYVKIMKKS